MKKIISILLAFLPFLGVAQNNTFPGVPNAVVRAKTIKGNTKLFTLNCQPSDGKLYLVGSSLITEIPKIGDSPSFSGLNLPTTTSTTGIVFKNGELFLHDFGSIDNLFLGRRSGNLTSTAINNTFIGSNTGTVNTTGYAQVFLGTSAGGNNTTGNGNTNIGYQSNFRNASGNYNITLGTDAGFRNKASFNMFLGYHTGFNAANSDDITGSYNVLVGSEQALQLTTGFQNTTLGHRALYGITTGYSNIGVGYNSGFSCSSCNQNVLLGDETGQTLTTGTNNVYIGYRAGFYAQSSTYHNTGIGDNALFGVTTGVLNTGIGSGSGVSLTTGAYNTFLGYNAGNNASQKVDANFSIAIGEGAYTTKSGQAVFGGDNITETSLKGRVGIGTTSPVGAVDITSTTGALIVPRMTSAQRTALTGVNGSIVYQTDGTVGFYFYEDGAWVKK